MTFLEDNFNLMYLLHNSMKSDGEKNLFDYIDHAEPDYAIRCTI